MISVDTKHHLYLLTYLVIESSVNVSCSVVLTVPIEIVPKTWLTAYEKMPEIRILKM